MSIIPLSNIPINIYVYIYIYHISHLLIHSSVDGHLDCQHILSIVNNAALNMCVVAKSCLTLCNPMDYSLPGSPVHGILQARILEWVAISSSRGSSWPRDRTHISWIGSQVLYQWATSEAPRSWVCFYFACVFICTVLELHISDIIQYHTSLLSTLGCPKPSAVLWYGGGGNRALPGR